MMRVNGDGPLRCQHGRQLPFQGDNRPSPASLDRNVTGRLHEAHDSHLPLHHLHRAGSDETARDQGGRGTLRRALRTM